MENNLGRDEQIRLSRQLMKSRFAENELESDQARQVPQPPLTKKAVSEAVIPLSRDFAGLIKDTSYLQLLTERQSTRVFKRKSLSLEQLAFLLWSTQGVKSIKGNGYATLRPVPSAGARHAFETYIAAINVSGLEKGIYHYLPLEHALELWAPADNLEDAVSKSLCDQKWASKSAAVLYYSAVSYRSEWRYTTDAHKLMLLDAGHVVQNLYLSCHAIGCGTCAIAAYDQKESDRLINLDGEEEFIIYAAPVGVTE